VRPFLTAMPRLLLVEDNPAIAELMQMMLESSGHEASLAVDSVNAMRLLRETRPEILLMDLRLPAASDGIALIRDAKVFDPRLQILVLSGWPDDLDAAPEAALVQRVLCKPVNPELLLRVVAEIFDSRVKGIADAASGA
jgi:two-component system, OmpR family, response regulator MtrA